MALLKFIFLTQTFSHSNQIIYSENDLTKSSPSHSTPVTLLSPTGWVLSPKQLVSQLHQCSLHPSNKISLLNSKHYAFILILKIAYLEAIFTNRLSQLEKIANCGKISDKSRKCMFYFSPCYIFKDTRNIRTKEFIFMSHCSSLSELQQVSLRRSVGLLAGDFKLYQPLTPSYLPYLDHLFALIRFLLLLLFFNFYNSNLESDLAICIKQSLL